MDLENDKEDTIEVMNAVLRNDLAVDDKKASTTTNSKKNSKPKKKDSAFLYGNEVAVILKSSQTPEQKLTTVCTKYSEQLHANRKLMTAIKMTEGRLTKMQQENEQCQQQRSKAVLARSRLENLCRELQKLNKAQKEEIDLKLRLEEEKRKEISATFQNAFAEMNTLTSQNTEKNTKMREENLEMREKIKSVRERIELSEQQLEKVRQQAHLEVQLAEARMAKIKMEMTAEKESLLKEKQQLLLKLTEYQVKIQELSATEVGLRGQISMYTEKYDDFQNALTKSNEVFSGFNEEMTKMSKKISKLEKETNQWKQRWEKSNGALLNMAADKQTRDAEMAKLNQKVSLLQELCKVFQRERTELLTQLRAATDGRDETGSSGGIDNKINTKQVEELSKDCQNLKENLVQLQGSLAETIFESKTDDVDSKENDEKIAHKDAATASVILPENKEEIKVSGEENNEDKKSVKVVDEEVKGDDATSSTLDAQKNSDKIVVGDVKVEEKVEESIKLKENTPEIVDESMKIDDEGSEECASFEVIDKTALDETDATEGVVDLAPASSSNDSNDVKNDKVDEAKTTTTTTTTCTLQQSDTNSNNKKEIDLKDLSSSSSGEEKKNSDKPAKKIKDGKRKKK